MHLNRSQDETSGYYSIDGVHSEQVTRKAVDYVVPVDGTGLVGDNRTVMVRDGRTISPETLAKIQGVIGGDYFPA